MTVSKEFLELLLDTMAPLGPVVVKRMFGGAALSLDGLTFALILDDQIWLKTDPGGITRFEAEGSRPFNYATRQGHRVVTSYWRAPDRLLEEPDEMVEWARLALAAARRKATEKQKPALARASPRSGGKRRR